MSNQYFTKRDEDGRRLYFAGFSSDGYDEKISFDAEWADDETLRSATLWSEFSATAHQVTPADYHRLAGIFGIMA